MDGGGLSTSQAAEGAVGKENGAEEVSCKPKDKEIECVQIPSDGQKGSPICSSARAEEAGVEVSFELSDLSQPVAVYIYIFVH
jgi:hypothetical protein